MKDQAVLYPPGANDECYTPDYAVKALIARLDPTWTYWCPFDTEASEFVIQLRAAGIKVIHSHISTGQDFFTYQPAAPWDAIVSNPPFTNKAKIFERALSFNCPFALLMTLTWLNDAAPKRLFAEKPLQLLMFEERIIYKGMEGKVTFSSAYYCRMILRQQICFDSLKRYGMGGPAVATGDDIPGQLALFEEAIS